MGIKIEKEDFIKRLEKSHPYSRIEILEYESLTKPLKYKCLKCNKVQILKHASDIFSRLNPCDCKKDFHSREQKIRYFEKRQDILEVLEINRERSKIRCKKCGEVFDRTTVSLMASFDNCPKCNNGFIKQTNTKEQVEKILKKTFPNHEYDILESSTYHGKCKIYHPLCHFVYNGKFDNFLNSRGCPRCYRKISKGEQKIKAFLEKEKISFIQQKSLDLEEKTSKFKFDFFLPELNFAIEYNGEQHYKEKTGFFDGLEITQKRDKIKRDYCFSHKIELLTIPYWEYLNIETILISKLNDYRNANGKVE